MPNAIPAPCRCSRPTAGVTVTDRKIVETPRLQLIEIGRCNACQGAVSRYRKVRATLPDADWRPLGTHRTTPPPDLPPEAA